MIKKIIFGDEVYPAFQAEGFAAKFAFPFAFELGLGEKEHRYGYDIGCNRLQWCLPHAEPIDPLINPEWDAYHLPGIKVDYIFSSHCLEHLRDWVEALDYWATKIKRGGILFLYLPAPEQRYWRPWNNRKHIHSLYPGLLEQYFEDRPRLWCSTFVTKGYDLNHSFYAIAESIDFDSGL
jgi:SAM-dependent methyltransferase